QIEVRKAIRPRDKTPLARLRALGRGYLQWARAHEAHFRIVSARDQIDLAGSPALQASMQAVRALTEQTLHEAQAVGEVNSAHDAAALALLSRATVYGLARMQLDGHLPQWGVKPGGEAAATEATLALLVRLMAAGASGAPAA
ncbi:TetR-like C-terminal domain-containing protein, partial [Ideonella azotifigens]